MKIKDGSDNYDEIWQGFLKLSIKNKKIAFRYIRKHLSRLVDDELVWKRDRKLFNWFEKELIDSLLLHKQEYMVIEVKDVKIPRFRGTVERKIAQRYFIKPYRAQVFNEKLLAKDLDKEKLIDMDLDKQTISGLMEEIYFNTRKVIEDLQEQLDISNKDDIYKIIGDAMGYTADAIKKRIGSKKNPKSINAELIAFLEQEFNIHRDRILGPFRIKHYNLWPNMFHEDNESHFPNLDDVYRDLDNIATKGPYVEEDLRSILELLAKRLKNCFPHRMSDEKSRLEFDRKWPGEIKKIMECLSRKE